MTFFLVLLLAAAPAHDAQAKYEAGDFEGALAILDAAVKTAPTGALHVARARCLNALRRNAELDAAFEAALAADPTVQVGADDSPGFRATFDRARARLAGTVEIVSEPPGAAVRIDGAMVGRAPVSQLLPVGRYTIGILDDAGAEVEGREVVVAPKQAQKIVLKRPVAVVVAPPPKSEPAPPERWFAVPTFAARVVVDPRAGAAVEVGLGLLARYWLVEVAGIGGGAPGIGARAGARFPFLDGWVAAQLTLDGAAFFATQTILGGGGTFSFVVRPVAFLDVSVDGSARFVQPSAGFRSEYGLVGLTLRLRWPNRMD